MQTTRRNTLIGLGVLTTGAGAVFGSGAFTTVEAERTVSIETAGDANAFLALEAARTDGSYVEETGDTIEILLDGTDSDADGLNPNGRSRFEGLVDITNNGSQNVQSLGFEIEVTDAGDAEGEHREAFKIVSGDTTIDADGTENLLSETGENPLEPTQTFTFGVEIDLTGGLDTIDDSAEFTLTITAETSE